mgnify:CR=1 FL=1
MGYSDGNLISDINNAEDWSGFHINIDLNGFHLNGLQPFKETAGCVVNNEKTVMLDGRDGTFKKGETTLTYSVPLSEDDTINTDDLQKPEKKGYTFRGWVAYPENSIIENQIFGVLLVACLLRGETILTQNHMTVAYFIMMLYLEMRWKAR